MKNYIHQKSDWPKFHWNRERLAAPLAEVSRQQGRLIGHMEALGFGLRQEAILTTMTSDVLKTSEIEGEKLDAAQVRSSVARRLGIEIAGLETVDRNVEGIVEVMLDATRNYAQALDAERLFGWHAALFPSGRNGLSRIQVGAWRDDSHGPMQVVSGPIGNERVHYEAPPAGRLNREMKVFLRFFNAQNDTDPILKAGLAHLWFVTVHPFDDGNGRIARAIADMQLARSERSPQRFYSMSTQIREERKAYYAILERTQSGTMDVSAWMEWFVACLGRAIARAQTTLGQVLHKAKRWESIRGMPLNARQQDMLNRLLGDFEGKLTTVQWAKLVKCSHDTALRDIQDLTTKGILVQDSAGGRSTSYSLAPLA